MLNVKSCLKPNIYILKFEEECVLAEVCQNTSKVNSNATSSGKIHTSEAALTIPNLSSESSDPSSRRLSPINEAKRLFDNEAEPVENRTRIVATRRFVAQTTEQPTNTPASTTKSSPNISTTTAFQPNTESTTEPSTTPVKIRPVLPKSDGRFYQSNCFTNTNACIA